jgi:16S rRNA U516 pseudouridylate synthase RsuA-like enzyme
MCEARGLRVLELHRESVMGIGLGGLQGEGWWAYLTEKEEEEEEEEEEE